MDWKMVVIGLTGLLGLYMVGNVMYQPLKFLVRLLACTVLGGIMLAAVNLLTGYFGLHVAINPVTMLAAGLLQLPGLVLLVLLNFFLAG